MDREKNDRTGWRPSRYNMFAQIPGSNRVACTNVFNGSFAVYSKEELYLLSEVESLCMDHPIIEHFRKRGLIVNYDELKALDAMGRLSSASIPFVNLTICPTMECNFRCPYCYVSEGKVEGIMSSGVQDDILALAERMVDASRAKTLAVRWYGGEPLLAPSVIENLSTRLMKLAESRGIGYKAWMFTNGYLLTQDIADMLGRCKVEKVYITLDGIGSVHDRTRPLAGGGSSFDRILRNLREQRLPFHVNVRHNLHDGNKDQAEKLKKLIRQIAEESKNDLQYYGADVRDYFSEVKDVQMLSAEDYSDLVKERYGGHISRSHGIHCDANTMWSVGVNPKGRLFKCWEFPNDEQMSFGSAATWKPEDPIGTADQPDEFTKYFTDFLPLQDPECRECKWLPVCLGQCAVLRFRHEGHCLFWKGKEEEYVLAIYRRMLRESKLKNI